MVEQKSPQQPHLSEMLYLWLFFGRKSFCCDFDFIEHSYTTFLAKNSRSTHNLRSRQFIFMTLSNRKKPVITNIIGPNNHSPEKRNHYPIMKGFLKQLIEGEVSTIEQTTLHIL